MKKTNKKSLNQKLITLERVLTDLKKRLISVQMQIELFEDYKKELLEERRIQTKE